MENEELTKLNLANKVFRLLSTDENQGIDLWKEGQKLLETNTDKDLPLVDVLACVYNAEAFVSNSLESILLQSYPNLNIIIVNDGSTDGTALILKQFEVKNSNILLIENSENKGIVYSANLGLQHCRGKYIARMDLDDLNHPLRIEKQVKYLEDHEDTHAVSSWLRTFDENGKTKEITFRKDFDEQKITQLFYSPIAHAACTFRAEIIKEMGYSNEFNDRGEDYHLFFRIMQKYKTAVLQECLYLYRTHSQQVTNQKHSQIIQNSTFKILGLIFKAMGLKHNSNDIQFHMKYLVLSNNPIDKQIWKHYDIWLQKIVNANSSSLYFNQKKLENFLLHNYWQTPFNEIKNELSMNDFVQILFSNKYFTPRITIVKELIKSIFRSVRK